MSPFAATIFLKKTFIKDKTGTFLTPSSTLTSITIEAVKSENKFFSDQIFSLENRIQILKNDYNNVLIECDHFRESINELENQLADKEKVKSE